MLIVYNIPEQGGWFVLEARVVCAIKVGGPFSTEKQAINYLNNIVINRHKQG